MTKYTTSSSSSTQIYYLFRCDDQKRPETMQTDEGYSLSEYEQVMQLKSELDTKGINYDLLIERFDTSSDEVLSNDYIVQNNYKNNLVI